MVSAHRASRFTGLSFHKEFVMAFVNRVLVFTLCTVSALMLVGAVFLQVWATLQIGLLTS